MKINRLDAHDRMQYFSNQNFDIGTCCQDLINQRPFGDHPFYIFAHARTEDDGINKRLIWQPRLTKPQAQTNSMLFKAYPGTDNIKVIWIIPAPEMWGQYKKGNVTESQIVSESIEAYKTNRKELEASEPDDLPESKIKAIYAEIGRNAMRAKGLVNRVAAC